MRIVASLLLLLLSPPASGQIVVVNHGDARAGEGSAGGGSVTVTPSFPYRGLEAEQLLVGQLGSTLQSGNELGSDLYLVATSADRIDIVDLATRTRTGQITEGLNRPRYLEFVYWYLQRAYVTNHVYDGTSYVAPVDLGTQTVGAPIEVDGLPEGLAILAREGKAYVALGASGPGRLGVDSLAVLDTEADTLLRYVDIECAARFVTTGAHINTWSGEEPSAEVVAFCEDTDEAVVVSVETDAVIQRLEFDEDIGDPLGVGQSVGPGEPIQYAIRRATPPTWSFLVITASGIAEVVRDEKTGVYRIESTTPIPEADTRPISAVAGPYTSDLYVLGRPDPDDPFVADGTITVHNRGAGALRATYPAGVYPTYIVLDELYPVAEADGPEAAGLRLSLAGANPVRHHTALDLALNRPASVRVDLLYGLGRQVRTVTEGDRVAGVHRLRLGVEGLAPGTYVVRAVAEGLVASLPLAVVR